MVQHYIAVLKPVRGGGWTAYFPDFMSCRADGTRIEMVVDRSKGAIAAELKQRVAAGGCVPTPLGVDAVRGDTVWATERGVDWSTAVTCLVEVDAG